MTEQDSREIPIIEVGKTSISETYDSDELDGYIDSKNKIFYALEQSTDEIKKLVRVKEEKDGIVILDLPKIKGEFKIIPISKLDRKKPFIEGDVFVLRNHVCTLFAAGTCINFSPIGGGAVTRSWTTTIARHLCAKATGRRCLEGWATLVGQTIHTGAGCTGPTVIGTISLPFCEPT